MTAWGSDRQYSKCLTRCYIIIVSLLLVFARQRASIKGKHKHYCVEWEIPVKPKQMLLSIIHSYNDVCVYSIVGSKAESATNGTTLDNPVYDSGIPGREDMDTERDLDNPIYGLPDKHTVEGTYSMPDDISHFDAIDSSIST